MVVVVGGWWLVLVSVVVVLVVISANSRASPEAPSPTPYNIRYNIT